MGKGVVHGIGVGQRRVAFVKGCGETSSEEFISETRFEEWDTISCVKIWKKSILGKLPHHEARIRTVCWGTAKGWCSCSTVTEEQSREKTDTGEAETRSCKNLDFYLLCSGGLLDGLIKKVMQSDLCFRKFTECCELCRNRGLSGSWHYTSMMWWWLRLGL